MNFNISLKSIMSDEVLCLTFKVYFVELNCPEANELPDFIYNGLRSRSKFRCTQNNYAKQRNIMFLILV